MNSCKYLLKGIIKNAAVPLYSLCLMVTLFMTFIFDGVTFGRDVLYINATNIEQALSEQQNRDPHTTQRDLDLISRALNATDMHAFYELNAQYYKNQLDGYETGQVIGDRRYDEAAYMISRWLSNHPEDGFEGSKELPALYSLPYAVSVLPPLLWFLPSVLVAFRIGDLTKRTKLLGYIPQQKRIRFISEFTSGLIAICLLLLVAVLPPMLFSVAVNGIGEPTYPVIFYRGSTLVYKTALSACIETLVILVLGNTFLLTVSLGVKSVFDSAIAGGCISAALAVTPMIAGYYENPSLPDSIMALLPTTYLSPSMITGYVGCFPTESNPTIPPVSYTGAMGMVTLCASAAIIFLITLVTLQKEINSLTKEESACALLKARISILQVDKTVLYEHAEVCMRPSKIYGLIAPNGQGKTTLMKALAGKMNVQKNSVSLMFNKEEANDFTLREMIFYAPGDGSLLHPSLTVRDHVEMVHALWRSNISIDEAIDLTGIAPFLEKTTKKLSQGMKQQVVMALAYVSGSRYVFLDEPTNGLDLDNSEIVASAIEHLGDMGRGVLVSSHMLDTLDDVCNTFIFIKDRKLIYVDKTNHTDKCRDLYKRFYGRRSSEL